VMVLVSATFAVARTDLLMHRAGGYIAGVEQMARATQDGGGWERLSSTIRLRVWFQLTTCSVYRSRSCPLLTVSDARGAGCRNVAGRRLS
jgi:hypothetical protein